MARRFSMARPPAANAKKVKNLLRDKLAPTVTSRETISIAIVIAERVVFGGII